MFIYTLQVRCTRCSHCSNTFDPFLDLSVEIGNAATLMKALHNFTEEELLDGGEKHYNCQQCKEKVVAKKRFLIDKAPFVLAIHLKRFSPFNPLQKIDKKVDFHTTLNLKPFVSNSEVSYYFSRSTCVVAYSFIFVLVCLCIAHTHCFFFV